MFWHPMVPSSGSATCTLFTAGPLFSSVAWSSASYLKTSYQEEATHKNSGKKAEDQTRELNQGPAVRSILVALPEDGNMGC
jgi:hypothetical protein